MSEMTKQKTSLNIDDKVWKNWLVYVVTTEGSARKVSELTAKALEEYMTNHPLEAKA